MPVRVHSPVEIAKAACDISNMLQGKWDDYRATVDDRVKPLLAHGVLYPEQLLATRERARLYWVDGIAWRPGLLGTTNLARTHIEVNNSPYISGFQKGHTLDHEVAHELDPMQFLSHYQQELRVRYLRVAWTGDITQDWPTDWKQRQPEPNVPLSSYFRFSVNTRGYAQTNEYGLPPSLPSGTLYQAPTQYSTDCAYRC